MIAVGEDQAANHIILCQQNPVVNEKKVVIQLDWPVRRYYMDFVCK